MVTNFLEAHGRRLVRYAGVSVVGVMTGMTLLFLCYQVLDMAAAPANVVAVMIGTIPSYVLNRRWVWGRSGTHSWRAEIAPFWAMALLGLILSTVLVHVAEQRSDSWVLINGANLTAFGSLWVIKYAVLDRVLFASTERHAMAGCEHPVA